MSNYTLMKNHLAALSTYVTRMQRCCFRNLKSEKSFCGAVKWLFIWHCIWNWECVKISCRMSGIQMVFHMSVFWHKSLENFYLVTWEVAKWFLIWVYSDMFIQMWKLGKFLVTLGAAKWFFISLYFDIRVCKNFSSLEKQKNSSSYECILTWELRKISFHMSSIQMVFHMKVFWCERL